MDAAELTILVNHDRTLSRTFQGVLAYDEIPNSVSSYPASYIINTDSKNERGEHWVAVYFETQAKAEIFDSYGLHPYGQIYLFAKRNASRVFYNKLWLQSPMSDVCGVYCIYFLYWRAHGRSLGAILNDFHEYYWKRNDSSVIAWGSQLTDV